MSPNLNSPRFRQRLSRVDVTFVSAGTEAVFFDVELETAPQETRITLGLLNYSMDTGVCVEIESSSGEVRNFLEPEQLLGRLDRPLSLVFPCSIGLEIEKFGSVYLAKLVVGIEKLVLPAFYLKGPTHLNGMIGFHSPQHLSAPTFGRHELCTWGDQVIHSVPERMSL